MHIPVPRARVFVLAAACLALAPAPVRALAPAAWDSGDPTPEEQHVLEMINRARADPAAEGQRLGININEGVQGATATPRPPLAMNKLLLGTARAHSADMYARKYFAHSDPDGKDPFDRMDASGYAGIYLGENIAAGSSHAAEDLEDILMRDTGYPGRGHRVNLLDIGSPAPFREIGVGYGANAVPITGAASAGVNGLKDFITQDLGSNATGPFVLGVVYADANSNELYDPGEGLAGVTVTPGSGAYFAVTGAAGGYAFPTGTSGSLTITASGGALPEPVVAHATLTGTNLKVDFLPGKSSGGGGSKSLLDTDADGFPDEIETALGTSPSNGADTPSGGAQASPVPLGATKLAIRLSFAAPSKDSVKLTCRVPVGAGLDPNGKSLVVDVGGVVRTYTLDARGRASGLPSSTVQLKLRRVKGAVVAQDALLTVRLTKDAVAADLADEGLRNATTPARAEVSVPAIVLFDGGFFTETKLLRWSAKAGKSGSAK